VPTFFCTTSLNKDDYTLIKEIGHGKYSNVFSGIHKSSGRKCVIKVLKPIKLCKIKREIKILQNLAQANGHENNNIIKLLGVYCDKKEISTDNKNNNKYKDKDKAQNNLSTSLVFEHINNLDYKILYPTFTSDDICLYMHKLLTALEFAHSNGIMHRDVKPQNIVIDHQSHKLRLIDWGLAEFYHPGKEYHVSVSTRMYKAPELLTGMRDYDYAVDIWSLACTFAGMLFKVNTIFDIGDDNHEQLCIMVNIFGTNDFLKYVSKYDLASSLENDDNDILDLINNDTSSFPKKRINWKKYITDANKSRVTKDALDLLDKMFQYDHKCRPTCKEALQHPYFKNL